MSSITKCTLQRLSRERALFGRTTGEEVFPFAVILGEGGRLYPKQIVWGVSWYDAFVVERDLAGKEGFGDGWGEGE